MAEVGSFLEEFMDEFYCQENRVMGLSNSKDHMILASVVCDGLNWKG